MTFTVNPNNQRPLYRQLEDSIRQAISSGRLEPGERLPAIRAICDDTGLAYATVSKVTRQLVNEGLLVAKTGAGTRVADSVSAVGRSATGCLGIASISSLAYLRKHSPYFTTALVAIQDEGVNQGYVVAYDRWSSSRCPLQLFQELTCVDGIIVFNSDGVTSDDIHALASKTDRLVCLGGAARPDGVPIVHSDNIGTSRQATEKLIEMGHAEIGFVTRPLKTEGSRERYRGYSQALEAAGLPVRPEYYFDADEDGMARQLLALTTRPTALLVANGITDFAANLPLLYQNDVRIGRDLYLAAWDELNFGTLQKLGVPYLRITQDVDALGHLAVKTLCAIIEGSPWNQDNLLLPAKVETIGHIPATI